MNEQGWIDIASAPKDGTAFLACWLLTDRAPLFGVLSWGCVDEDFPNGEEGWIENGRFVSGATHWMPLPSPPEPGK